MRKIANFKSENPVKLSEIEEALDIGDSKIYRHQFILTGEYDAGKYGIGLLMLEVISGKSKSAPTLNWRDFDSSCVQVTEVELWEHNFIDIEDTYFKRTLRQKLKHLGEIV